MAKKKEGNEETLKSSTFEFKIEALRRLGDMLKDRSRAGPEYSKGGGGKGSKGEPLPDAPPTLSDLGLDKKISHIARKLAELPQEQFEAVREGTS